METTRIIPLTILDGYAQIAIVKLQLEDSETQQSLQESLVDKGHEKVIKKII
jgi:hypothetical protein